MTTAVERRRFARRQDDQRPDGGAFIITLCIFSMFAAAAGFIGGTWFGWFLR